MTVGFVDLKPSFEERQTLALERIADILDKIEKHLAHEVTSGDIPPRYVLHGNGRDIIDYGATGHRDNLEELTKLEPDEIDGWIKWSQPQKHPAAYIGDDAPHPPVANDTSVDVRFDTFETNSGEAGSYRWNNVASWRNITAYRIHKEPAK